MKCFDIKKNGFFIISVALFFVFFPLKGNVAKAYVCITGEEQPACRDIQSDFIPVGSPSKCLNTEVTVKGHCSDFPADDFAPDRGCVNGRGDCYKNVQSLTVAGAQQLCGFDYADSFVINRKCPDVKFITPQPVAGGMIKRGCIKSENGVCYDVEVTDGADFLKRANDKCVGTYGNDARLQVSECGPDREYPCYFNDAGACAIVKANTPESASSSCMQLCRSKNKIRCYVNLNFNDKCQEDSHAPLAGTSLADLQKTALAKLNPAKISSPTTIISRAINLMTAFIGSIALLLYVVAGFLWMTASGASEQVDKAKKILVWTTLGVVVMLASYILTSTLFGFIPK